MSNPAIQPVHTAISLPMERLVEFCRKWGITEMAVFGSVLREDFGPESDVDFLIRPRSDARLSLFDWVDMQDELASLVGRQVDLVDREGVETSINWYRRREILNSAKVIYAD